MATSHNPVKINPGCRGSKTIFVSKKFRETTEHMQFQVSHYALYRPRLLGDKYQIHLTDSDAASIKTVELLLRCLNDISLPSEFFEVSIDEVWRVLTLVDITAPQYSRAGKFNVPCNVLFDWFESWFGCNASGFTKRHQYEQLLYPTFVFGSDYFCDVTRWLVWNVNGQLQDRNPLMEDKNLSQSYGDMRLSKDVFRECSPGFLFFSFLFFYKGS
ncbi:hypothetical protein F4782DRAFT_470196 [Xylaria castorea]|nr:hypothetical protein F4782DRAFT_470196 [Xylaria castorea]